MNKIQRQLHPKGFVVAVIILFCLGWSEPLTAQSFSWARQFNLGNTSFYGKQKE